ncbi:TMV resistance protein N-like [Dorcoceras hygrometricum]|uniref:TMV resistance protein N-like n=1 Tax=Dorcoceras hygrometricum TaxID=472368 RepID=A0A2Z7D536_9LAMI|nr:TMV resistance protein N-like [Dorcoceras hygrometricum]
MMNISSRADDKSKLEKVAQERLRTREEEEESVEQLDEATCSTTRPNQCKLEWRKAGKLCTTLKNTELLHQDKMNHTVSVKLSRKATVDPDQLAELLVQFQANMTGGSRKYPDWNSEGTSKMVRLKISMLEQFGDARAGIAEEIRIVGNVKLVHQLDTRAGPEKQLKSSDQAQWDAMKCRMIQEQTKCSVQAWCSSTEPSYFSERLDEIEAYPNHWSRGRI